MHKGPKTPTGRNYPYHPTYFATEAWFWPRYLPWKMTYEVVGFLPYPWNFPGSLDRVSAAGVPYDDNRGMRYNWTDVPYPTLNLQLKMWSEKVAGVARGFWELSIAVDLHGWARACQEELSPVPRNFNHSWNICPLIVPYMPVDVPDVQTRPASYAEGGSPWL